MALQKNELFFKKVILTTTGQKTNLDKKLIQEMIENEQASRILYVSLEN
ncbi:MAG: hypothetical protein WC679_00325 [Bacteroidales bacterium]|jgi:hypothetical protein